jgi:phosphopantothenoylcysteine decarboxylase/phosphopantothenate--cysteine ligase
MGAEVHLVSGPVQMQTKHLNISRQDVESAQEMYDVAVETYPNCDAAILCAAVADFTPEKVADEKVKREGDEFLLKLKPTKDIAAALGYLKKEGQRLVGFALETNNEEKYAREKLARKNLDFIVLNSLNDKGAGFSYDTNKVTFISSDEIKTFPLKNKKEVAQDIVNKLCEFFD